MGLSFWAYLQDRLRERGQIAWLPDLIRAHMPASGSPAWPTQPTTPVAALMHCTGRRDHPVGRHDGQVGRQRIGELRAGEVVKGAGVAAFDALAVGQAFVHARIRDSHREVISQALSCVD